MMKSGEHVLKKVIVGPLVKKTLVNGEHGP